MKRESGRLRARSTRAEGLGRRSARNAGERGAPLILGRAWTIVLWSWLASVAPSMATEPGAPLRLATPAGEARLAANISSPRAAAELYRWSESAAETADLPGLRARFGAVADDARAHPEVRALARWLAAQADVDLGANHAAKEALDRLGFARGGWLVGGFETDSGNGHDEPFGPEQAPIDLGSTYVVAAVEKAWRRLPPAEPSGLLALGDVVSPRARQTTYVLTQLSSDRARTATLAFGTSGATKVWVGGRLVFDDRDDHPARFDQSRITVTLARGANPVLLKISTGDQAPGFYLRSGDPGVVFEEPDAGFRMAVPLRDAGERQPSSGLAQVLEQQVRDAPRDAALRADLAIVLEARRSFDAPERRHLAELEHALQSLDLDFELWERLGRWIEHDADRKRRAFDRAMVLDPKALGPRIGLAEEALRMGFPRRAYDLLERSPDLMDRARAVTTFAAACDALGLEGRASRLRLDAAERLPSSPEASLGAARTLRALGRIGDAEAAYRRALSLRRDLPSARVELSSMLADAGRLDAAVELLRDQLALHPSRVSNGMRLAELLSMNDRAAAANEVYERLVELAPDQDTLFEARGRHWLRLGQVADAAAAFRRSLALRPQHPRLRELLRSIEPQDAFAAPYLRDLATLARAESQRPTAPDDDTIVLADIDVVRVFENGLSSRVRQRIVRVVNQRGVELERVQSIAYAPGEQEVRTERARVLKPGGSIVETHHLEDRALAESGGGMYFDQRVQEVQFSELAPGDVVEWTYRVDDAGQRNLFADYFGDLRFLQGSSTRRELEYVLLSPSSRPIYANTPRLAHVEHSEATQGPTTIRRWRASDVPKIVSEPRTPGAADVAAYLHVSTFRDWSDVARFWWGLVREQLHVTPEVARAAEEAVDGIASADVAGRVRAVYAVVVRKTRYVGLEFGIHGFKPYPVDRVLARRFGDCKDKASLMHAMLAHLGIPSQLVLVRMHHLGRLEPQPASLAAFNHAILYVPSLDLYLDGTAEFSGADELPEADRAAQALIVDGDVVAKSRLVVTPAAVGASNETASSYRVRLDRSGGATIQGGSRVSGTAAEGWRRHFEAGHDRRQKLEERFAATFPGARVVTFDMTDPARIELPVEAKFTLEVPSLARAESDELVFTPFGRAFRYLEGLAPMPSRSLPLELGGPWTNTFRYELELPDGMALRDGAGEQAGESRFGSWRIKVESVGRGVVVEGAISLNAATVMPTEYPQLRVFFDTLDRAFARPLRIGAATEASR